MPPRWHSALETCVTSMSAWSRDGALARAAGGVDRAGLRVAGHQHVAPLALHDHADLGTAVAIHAPTPALLAIFGTGQAAGLEDKRRVRVVEVHDLRVGRVAGG